MFELVVYGWWLSPMAMVGLGTGFLLIGIGLVMMAGGRKR